MSVKSHSENQTNSDENTNDHATGVEYCEESDTYKCLSCGTLKPTREGAEQHCGDADGNEGLSTTSSHEPPETLCGDDIWLCWRYEKRDGKKTKVPINPTTGGRGSSTAPDSWVDHETARNYHAGDATDTEGLGFVFSKEGLLAGVDLDNVRDPDTGEIEPWAKEVLDKLDSYTELSPSSTGFHIVVFGMKPGDKCKVGMESTLDTFDEAELEMYQDGRFFTYTGEHVEGTPTTVERRNGSLSEVYNEHLADDDGSAATAEIEGSKPDLNLSDEKILEKARNAKNSQKFTRLYEGDNSYHDNDTSKADKAFCQMLAYWTGGDRNQMDRLFRNSGRMRTKWDEDRGNQTYGERTLEAALNDQTEFYDPSNTSLSEPREPRGQYDSVADALVADPEGWIDPDEKVITALAAGGMSADDVAKHLRDGELPGGDSVVLDVVGELEGENRDAFLDFWNGDGEEWTITTASGNGWKTIRQSFYEKDMTKNQARYKTYQKLCKELDFATFKDTDSILVYNQENGIYELNGETTVKSRLHEGLNEHYTNRTVRDVLEKVKGGSYFEREEFGPSEDNPQVCVGNRVLNLTEIEKGNDEVIAHGHGPQRRFLSALPVDYDPTADCPNFDRFLGKVLANKEDKQLIYEFIGYCLWPGYPFEKAAFFYGTGRNGKSTLINVITELLGEDNVSGCGIDELENERFATADLFGKFANVAGDLNGGKLSKTNILKKLTGNDSKIRAQHKNESSFEFKNRAKLFFAFNELPEITDTTDGMFSRPLVVRFPNKFTPEGQPGGDKKPPNELMDEIANDEELSGILNKSLSALADVFDRGSFVRDESIEQARRQYQRMTEPVYRFIQERIVEDPDGYVRKQDVFDAYDEWAQQADEPEKSNSELGGELKNYGGLSDGRKRVGGSQLRVYKDISIR